MNGGGTRTRRQACARSLRRNGARTAGVGRVARRVYARRYAKVVIGCVRAGEEQQEAVWQSCRRGRRRYTRLRIRFGTQHTECGAVARERNSGAQHEKSERRRRAAEEANTRCS